MGDDKEVIGNGKCLISTIKTSLGVQGRAALEVWASKIADHFLKFNVANDTLPWDDEIVYRTNKDKP